MSCQCLKQDGVVLDLYNWARSLCVFDPGPYTYHRLPSHWCCDQRTSTSGDFSMLKTSAGCQPTTSHLRVLETYHQLKVVVIEQYPTRQALVYQKLLCVCISFSSDWHQLEWKNCSISKPHIGDTVPTLQSCSPE